MFGNFAEASRKRRYQASFIDIWQKFQQSKENH
nr:hypothetical protein [Umezakia ovalisporum]